MTDTNVLAYGLAAFALVCFSVWIMRRLRKTRLVPSAQLSAGLGLRRMVERDIETAASISTQNFGPAFGNEWCRGFLDKLDRFGVVADLHGRMAGLMTCVLQKDCLYLFTFAVQNSFRGLGIGRQMSQWLLDALPRFRRSCIRLCVAGDNRAALSLYESLGFKRLDGTIVAGSDSIELEFHQPAGTQPRGSRAALRRLPLQSPQQPPYDGTSIQ